MNREAYIRGMVEAFVKKAAGQGTVYRMLRSQFNKFLRLKHPGLKPVTSPFGDVYGRYDIANRAMHQSHAAYNPANMFEDAFEDAARFNHRGYNNGLARIGAEHGLVEAPELSRAVRDTLAPLYGPSNTPAVSLAHELGHAATLGLGDAKSHGIFNTLQDAVGQVGERYGYGVHTGGSGQYLPAEDVSTINRTLRGPAMTLARLRPKAYAFRRDMDSRGGLQGNLTVDPTMESVERVYNATPGHMRKRKPLQAARDLDQRRVTDKIMRIARERGAYHNSETHADALALQFSSWLRKTRPAVAEAIDRKLPSAFPGWYAKPS